jgi:hypothetical protein
VKKELIERMDGRIDYLSSKRQGHDIYTKSVVYANRQ